MNVTAWLPLSAQRRTSAAASSGVPQRHDRERDEPALAGTAAPLVDHPVVVDLDARQREFLVLTLEERLAAEAGEHVREADRGVDVVGVHVGEALGLVEAAGADLVERERLVVEDLEADRGREPGNG